MRQLIIILSVILVITNKSVKAQDDNGLYSRRYERLDIGTILASPRLVTNYVDCLLNKKPCPPEGKALKRILPEALRTKCEKCWPNQKEGALKVITALYNDYPKHYNALREKWDPTGEYNRRFEEYLRDQSFNTIGSNNNNNNNNYLDNDDINQGEQTQVTTTIVANTNKKSSPTNSNSITTEQSHPHKSNKRPTSVVQNHTTNSHSKQTVQSPPRNLKNTLPTQSQQNSKVVVQTKSPSQNSKRIAPSIENHRTNSNRIPSVINTPSRNSNRIQSQQFETIPSSSNRIQSVQTGHPKSSRLQQIQTPATNSNRITNSVQTIRTNSNGIPSPIPIPNPTSNRVVSLQTAASNSNRFLLGQTPLLNFNIIPSVGNPTPNFNRFSLSSTPSPPKTNHQHQPQPSNQNYPFNLNIIPSIQTALNLNRVSLLLSPHTNTIPPFIQSPAYFNPSPSTPSSFNRPSKSIETHINGPAGKQQTSSTNQISYRFSNNESPLQNTVSFSQRSASNNIPKPTKISTVKVPTTTRIPPKTRSPTIRVATTKTSRRSQSSQISTTRHNNNNEITQRPTRQGARPTTTVQTTRPTTIRSSTIKQTTLRQTTINPPIKRQTTKRLTTTTTTSRPSTTMRTTTTELPVPSSEINPPNDLFNRFGSEDEIVVTSTTTAPKTTKIRRQPTRPLINQPQPPISPQYLPGFVTTTTVHSNNHLLNIFNRITTKLSNTADFVAGVLRVPQAIIQNTRNHHRVIWQNLANNKPQPRIQKDTTLTFRLF